MNLHNGKTFKKVFYRWIGKLNNEIIYLNLKKKKLFNHKFIIYCQNCHKKIHEYKLCKIFALRNTDKIIISNNANFYCKKCATSLNAINGLEKRKQTCLKKYGVEHIFQSKDFIEHTRNIYKEKYSNNWKKVKASTMINYWKNNQFIRHNGDDPIIRAKMVESWKRTVAKKTPEEISKWRKAILTTKSKIATEFLNKLAIELNVIIEKEVIIGTKHVDGFLKDKCIIEFYGNFWHANPNIYLENDIISHHGKSLLAREIWEKDKKRIEEILQYKNLPIIIVWEQSYINNKELTIESISNYIKSNKLSKNQIYYF